MSAAAAPGALLGGRYRLVSRIGSGGMCDVWEGQDLSLTRRVAIKILQPHLTTETDHARFQQEALASAKLQHPGIVGVYDTIRESQLHAVVFEFVDGRSLRQELDQHRRLDFAQVVAIGAAIADALDAAHRQGVIHRDIKPANIMLAADGRVVLMDFGIAKDSDQLDLTTDSLFLGTPKYAAPEQVSGAAVDPRTDVYALCAVLYEAACGKPPFVADTDIATAMMRLSEDPSPPRTHRSSIPDRLERTILRGLQRSPADRFESANALRNALTDPDADASFTTLDAPFHKTERAWLVPTVFVVVTMIALTVAALLLRQTTTGEHLVDRVNIAFGGERPSEQPLIAPSNDFTLDTVGVVSIASYDPFGSGIPGEHDELLANADDGSFDTLWKTETYENRTFGTKPGVGLILSLERDAILGNLQIHSASQDWSIEIYVADEIPSDFTGWGTPGVVVQRQSAASTIDLSEHQGRVVLIWIVDLGRDGQFQLAELSLEAIAT